MTGEGEPANLEIISGGQTGVDRAALDVALELGLACGGWCPHGRRAEDGAISERYPLQETRSPAYPVRTRWNVRDSDGTLILARGRLSGGTGLTRSLAKELRKPFLVVDLNGPVSANVIRQWMKKYGIGVLNVAGPRESSQPGIHAQAAKLLRKLLKPLAHRVHSRKQIRKPKE